MLSLVVEQRIGAPWQPGLVDVEEELERPSCDVAAVAAARGVADMQMAALGTEGSRKLVAYAPALVHTYVHVDHGLVMTRLMPENWIVGYDRLVVEMVSAACGQPPLGRVLLINLVSLSSLDESRMEQSRQWKLRTCRRKMP